jgi:hypothetical protein
MSLLSEQRSRGRVSVVAAGTSGEAGGRFYAASSSDVNSGITYANV